VQNDGACCQSDEEGACFHRRTMACGEKSGKPDLTNLHRSPM
jgi:hypothetical protein